MLEKSIKKKIFKIILKKLFINFTNLRLLINKILQTIIIIIWKETFNLLIKFWKFVFSTFINLKVDTS